MHSPAWTFAWLPADDLLSDDMLSGEEEDGTEQGRHGRANGTPRQFSEDEDEDGWEAATDAGVQQNRLDGSEQEDDEDGAELAPSAHARRQQRMQEKIRCISCFPGVLCQFCLGRGICSADFASPCLAFLLLLDRKLEAAAMGEKDWFMQGEVDAGHRPKNSALEVDLDFETTVKPPPQVSRMAAHTEWPPVPGAVPRPPHHLPLALPVHHHKTPPGVRSPLRR